MLKGPEAELLCSGEFARRSRLSPMALRIYDQIGPLRPVHVEPSDGYRSYVVDQLRAARLIAMLRGIDMGLAEIGLLLADLATDVDLAIERPDRHLAALEARHAGRRSLVRHIRPLLRTEDLLMFVIHTRHVPARRLMSIQPRILGPETDTFVREAKSLFREHHRGTQPCRSFSLIFHGAVGHESDGLVEQVGPEWLQVRWARLSRRSCATSVA
jgi:DNA-binding transcriptional MerR regulator